MLTVANKDLGVDIVRVEVYHGNFKYFIHENLLIQSSPYFKAAIRPGRKKGDLKILILEASYTQVFANSTTGCTTGRSMTGSLRMETRTKMLCSRFTDLLI